MLLTKLAQNQRYFGLVTVLLLATLFYNNPDPELEKRVSDLEDRVTALEEKLDVETDDNSFEKSQYRENWRQLREGMKMDKVEELLGSPQRIDGGSRSVWYYLMGGSVYFNDRGRLERWSEPF